MPFFDRGLVGMGNAGRGQHEGSTARAKRNCIIISLLIDPDVDGNRSLSISQRLGEC